MTRAVEIKQETTSHDWNEQCSIYSPLLLALLVCLKHKKRDGCWLLRV